MSDAFYTLFFFGDSITWGMTDSQGGWAKRISQKLQLHCAYHPHIHIMDYHLGIPGNTAFDVLARFENEVKSRQMDGWQKICLFAIGTNDCQYDLKEQKARTTDHIFEQQIQEIMGKAEKLGIEHIGFVGLPPVDEARTVPMPHFSNIAFRNIDISAKNKILRDICAAHDIPFADIEQDWQNLDVAPLLDDGLHPNDQGHMRIEQCVYTAFCQKIWPDCG